VLLPPAKTLDAIWRPTAAGDHAVYDRALYLTSAGAPEGGMLTYLAVTAGGGGASPAGTGSGRGCGLGFELGLLLPVLMGLRRRAKR
jgi:hypothetical protein